MKKLFIIDYFYGGDNNFDWYWAENEKEAWECLYEAHEINKGEIDPYQFSIVDTYQVFEALEKDDVKYFIDRLWDMAEAHPKYHSSDFILELSDWYKKLFDK